MKLYIYKDRIYHECKYLNFIIPFYSSNYTITNGEAKCRHCRFTAPGFLFIANNIKSRSRLMNCSSLPEGGKWLEL